MTLNYGRGDRDAYAREYGTINYNIITYEGWIDGLFKPLKQLRKHGF